MDTNIVIVIFIVIILGMNGASISSACNCHDLLGSKELLGYLLSETVGVGVFNQSTDRDS